MHSHKAVADGKNIYSGFVDHLRPGGNESELEPVQWPSK